MAQKRGSFTAIPGRRSIVSVEDGGTYREIPGITSFSYVPGEKPSTESSVLEGTRSVLGAIPVTDITFPVGAYTPNARPWTVLRKSYVDEDIVNIRIVTPEIEVFNVGTARVAIAQATGECTFTGEGAPVLTQAKFQRGMVIIIGANAYVLEEIDEAAAVKPKAFPIEANGLVNGPPAASVAATAFRIVVPSLRWIIGGSVKSFGGFEAGSEEGNILSSNLVFTPTANAGDASFVPAIVTS